MHSSIPSWLRSGALCSAWLLAACGDEAVVRTLDATLLSPAAPGEAYSLVRSSPDNEIHHLALSDDYVFIGIPWEGVYRLSKYGGELSPVEQDSDAAIHGVAASRDRVYWVHATFGPKDEPHLELRTRAAAGGATDELRNAEWIGGTANYTSDLLADNHHLYLAAGPAVIATPLDGGEPVSVATYDRERTPTPENPPSWVPDYPALYASTCLYQQPCALVRGDFSTASTESVAALEPAMAVAAVDETSLYLQGNHSIWKSSKTDFSRTRLFEASDESEFVHWFLQVDATHVYFITSGTDAGSQLRAIPKSGGPAATIGTSERLNRGVWRMVQDDQFLFVLVGPGVLEGPRTGNEVLAFPKVPALAAVQ